MHNCTVTAIDSRPALQDALSIKVTRRLAALQQQWEIKEAQARAEQLRRQQQRQQQQQARLKANA